MLSYSGTVSEDTNSLDIYPSYYLTSYIFYGTIYSDAINLVGRTGYSHIYSYGGADTIYLDRTNITVYGGEGADLIDYRYATQGISILLNYAYATYSINEIEHVSGSNFDDNINALYSSVFAPGKGWHSLSGQGGNDRITGGTGDDLIFGGTGNDILHGGSGFGLDYVSGEDGNDIIYGSYSGRFFGGTGYDLFVINSGQTATIDGGADFDTLRLEASARVTVSATSGLATVLSPTYATTTVNFKNVEAVLGSAGSDTFNIIDDGLNTVIDGRGGSDTVSYLSITKSLSLDFAKTNNVRNFETLRASTFGDLISTEGSQLSAVYGQAGSDLIIGRLGSELLHGDEGNDVIYGNGGTDTIYGGAGDDYLFGHGNNTTLVGGAGNDSFFFQDLYSSAYETKMYVFGGEGNNTLSLGRLSRDPYTLWIDMLTQTADIYQKGADGSLIRHHTIVYSDITNFVGSSNNDTIFAGDYSYITVDGGSGNDMLSYRYYQTGITLTLSDRNSFHFVSNVERIIGSNHADTLIGDAHNNILNGSAGDDQLFGNAGNDRLIGDLGSDTLNGGLGDDTLVITGDVANGGAGRDRFVLDSISPSAVLSDFEVGTGGDLLNIHKLLYHTSYFYTQNAQLTDFFRIGAVDGKTYLQYDADGKGSYFGWSNVANFANNITATFQHLLNNNQIESVNA